MPDTKEEKPIILKNNLRFILRSRYLFLLLHSVYPYFINKDNKHLALFTNETY